MKNKLLKIALLIALILLAIYAVRIIKNTDSGTPNQGNKGNPMESQ